MARPARAAVLGVLFAAFALAACAASGKRPMQTFPEVDMPRFMGDWYVIASIPTFVEKGAHNAVESYAINRERTVATSFRFSKGAFDGPEKV
jgi:apolipoprotein D and lipocalin family protein